MAEQTKKQTWWQWIKVGLDVLIGLNNAGVIKGKASDVITKSGDVIVKTEGEVDKVVNKPPVQTATISNVPAPRTLAEHRANAEKNGIR